MRVRSWIPGEGASGARARGPGRVGAMLTAFALLASLALPEAASAQARKQRGFYLEWPFTVELAFETDLPVSDDSFDELAVREIDDTVVIVRPPAPSFRSLGRRLDLSATYQPDIELFVDHDELRTINHLAEARLDYRLTERLALSAGDAFLMTHDPSRDLGPTTFLLGRGRFQQNTLYAGLDYRITPLTNVAFRYDDIHSSLEFGPFVLLPAQRTRAWRGSLSHQFDRRNSAAVTYSLLDASSPLSVDLLERPDDASQASAPGFRLRSHNVAVGYRHALARGVHVEGSGGVIRDRAAAFYSLSGRLDVRLGGLQLLTGYDRGLSHTATGRFPGVETEPVFINDVVPNTLLESVRFQLEGYLGPDVAMDLQLWAGRRSPSVAEGFDGGLRQGETFLASLRVDWWIAESFAVFGGVESYVQDEAILAGIPVSRRRIITGLKLGVPTRSPVEQRREGQRASTR